MLNSCVALSCLVTLSSSCCRRNIWEKVTLNNSNRYFPGGQEAFLVKFTKAEREKQFFSSHLVAKPKEEAKFGAAFEFNFQIGRKSPPLKEIGKMDAKHLHPLPTSFFKKVKNYLSFKSLESSDIGGLFRNSTRPYFLLSVKSSFPFLLSVEGKS